MKHKYIKAFETFISNSTVGNGIEIDYQEGPNLRAMMGTTSKKLNIGVYYDFGVQQSTVDVWDIFFTRYFNINPVVLDTETVTYERLSDLDMLVIPGGKAFRQSLGLGPKHKEAIKKWVEDGGKLVAVCAGAHLVSQGHAWSLGIVPVKHFEKQEDLSQDILYLDFDITEKGSEVFYTNHDTVRLYYHGGPILYSEPDADIDVLLTFGQEVPHAVPDVKDFTKGKIAALISKYGKGEILTISPHIEKSHPLDVMLANAINYLIEKRYFQVF